MNHRLKQRLTLAVLGALAGLVKTDFLSFHFPGITGDESSLAQGFTQALIILDQGTGNAMSNGAGLAGDSAAGDGHVDVKGVSHVHRFKWLAYNHATGFSSEVLIQGTCIDGDVS